MKRFFILILAIILCFCSIGQIAFAEDIIDVSVSIADDIIGNNFYKDNPPCFNVSIKNLSSESQECLYIAKAINADGFEVGKISGIINVESGETAKQELYMPLYYGVLTFSLEVSTDGDIFNTEIPYTLSNHTADMPNNKRFGVTNHFNRGYGDLTKGVKLMTGAGIGAMRGEDLMWPEFEKKKGEYALTEYQKQVLDTLDKNDIDYMFIANYGNINYNDTPTEPVHDKEGYDALSKFIEELLIQGKGRIDYIEVWNEYHSSNMSGTFCTNAEVFAELHKAIYKGVQAGDKNVKVGAFVEDDWGFYETGMITKCLKELAGEKAFDYISLHPYTDDKIRYFEGDINSIPFLEDVKAEIEKYGYDRNTPIIFSELGWSDSFLDFDDNKKAAYVVRASAYTQALDLADNVFNYNLLDNWGDAAYGLLRSYQAVHSENGIAYFGKPAYTAVAYYNGLMAENTCNGELDTKSDNSYCYSFTDRMGRNILMLGTLQDDTTEKAFIDVGASEVIVSDMFGNEKRVDTDNGKLFLNLKDEPQYIINVCDTPEFAEGVLQEPFYAAAQTGQNLVSVYGCLGDEKTDYLISVYAPDKTCNDLNTEDDAKNTDVLVYYNQGTTDDDGVLDLKFNIDGGSGDYKVFLYSAQNDGIITPVKVLSFQNEGTEPEVTADFGLYKDGVLIGSEDKVFEKDKITVKANLKNTTETEQNAYLVYGIYEKGILKDMDFAKVTVPGFSSGIAFEKSFTVPDGADTVKGFLWESLETLKPMRSPVGVTVTQ